MKHVMIDLETLGTGNDAVIVSIGACRFDPYTGVVDADNTFHQGIDVESSVNDANRKLDPSTVMWWLKQEHDARMSLYIKAHNGESVTTVMQQFSQWLGGDPIVWGNGATFDLVKVADTCNAVGLATPWKFWNERDVRTVVEMGQVVGFDPKRDMPFEGVKHDALADAVHQSRYVCEIMQMLGCVR